MGTRYLKARTALQQLGVSVLGGAMTTIGAGVPLYLSTMNFFFEFGLFLTIIAGFSLLTSYFFMIPLLMIIGNDKPTTIQRLLHKKHTKVAKEDASLESTNIESKEN